MRALRTHSYDTEGMFSIDDVPVPNPGRGEVRIRMLASGISYVDMLRMRGGYQIRSPLPNIGGSEFAGIVDAVGSDVTTVKAGDKVAGLTISVWADYICVSEKFVSIVPQQADPVEVATLPAAYATALYALSNRGKLQAGETVLVLGSGGGVGYAGVQVAKALGARVIAAASAPAKRDAATKGGADDTVDTSDPDWKNIAKQVAGPPGVDVVFDPVGGKATDVAFRTLGWEGRHLMIGFASGSICALGTNLPLLKGASLVGVDTRAFAEREPGNASANLRRVMEMHGAGLFKPLINRTLPLTSYSEAFAAASNPETLGRVVFAW